VLDIKFVRENADTVKENLKRRGEAEKIATVDELLANDAKWRSTQSEANNLRGKRNKITEQVARSRKKGEDTSNLLKEAQHIPDQIKELEKQTIELEGKTDRRVRREDHRCPHGTTEHNARERPLWEG
jgi:seryl-tRNA synthetase